MKKSLLFLIIFIPFLSFSQVTDNFSDGDFAQNPVWAGNVDNFFVNANLQLQSKAATTSKSYLTTPSEAFDNASWECWVKINYNPTSSNYASVYIVSDRADISNELFGYYVQIGSASKDISLYVQEGAKKTKIIDGTDGRTNSNPAEVRVKVTRDAEGNFMLYSRLPGESNYYLEGSTQNMKVVGSRYFGLYYSNSSLTGNAYHFDDIVVTGDKFLDIIKPVWTTLALVESNKLILTFSESIDFSNADFQVDNGMEKPVNTVISSDKFSVELTFLQNFERGKIYTVTANNIRDLSGNLLENPQKQIGIVEKIEIGDLVINEILFDAAGDGAEYIEVYNNSGKILDMSKVSFGVRKADGTFTPSNYFPLATLLLPKRYLALTPNAEAVRTAYFAPDTAAITSPVKWSALSNTGADLLISNSAGDTIYDEVKYDVKWHHPLVKNTQGVSLERIHPSLPSQKAESWHSASSEVHYGTPGYKNSQYREISFDVQTEKWVWIEPETFTPDNDGTDDVCFIRYKTGSSGFTANAAIFNAAGMKIKQLASNILLSTEGVLTWNGQTNQGKNAAQGIYILYIEMINVDSGVKKIEKLPIVVSAK